MQNCQAQCRQDSEADLLAMLCEQRATFASTFRVLYEQGLRFCHCSQGLVVVSEQPAFALSEVQSHFSHRSRSSSDLVLIFLCGCLGCRVLKVPV